MTETYNDRETPLATSEFLPSLQNKRGTAAAVKWRDTYRLTLAPSHFNDRLSNKRQSTFIRSTYKNINWLTVGQVVSQICWCAPPCFPGWRAVTASTNWLLKPLARFVIGYSSGRGGLWRTPRTWGGKQQRASRQWEGAAAVERGARRHVSRWEINQMCYLQYWYIVIYCTV